MRKVFHTEHDQTLAKSRTTADLDVRRADSLTGTGKSNLNDSRLSVERRDKIDACTRDLADKIAALNENWMSIKKDQLETIAEARPIARDVALGAAKKKPATTAPTTAPTTILTRNGLREKKGEVVKPVSTAQHNSSGTANLIGKAKPSTSSNGINHKSSVNLSQSAIAGSIGGHVFDIGKAMEELDSIKTRMSTQPTLSRLTSQKSPPKVTTETSQIQIPDDFDPEDEDLEELELNHKDSTNTHGTNGGAKVKLDSLAARRAQRGVAVSGPTVKKLSLAQKKKMMDEIESMFTNALKKVKEFEKETGSSVRVNDVNREYHKMMDEMREIVKKN